jgi:hypothetical protein
MAGSKHRPLVSECEKSVVTEQCDASHFRLLWQRFWLRLVFLLALYFGVPSTAVGQEAVRMSLAGEAAAEERRKVELASDDYNLRLGPSAWAFTWELGLEANDNIDFVSSDPELDLIARPQLDARMFWRVSNENKVNLALGVGYSAYTIHPEYSRLFITPGSELSLNIYAGDFWVELHERFSITENAYQDPTVVGTADYSQLQNVAGLAATWDLNKVVLRLGYDHANYAPLSGTGGFPGGDSDILNSSAGHAFATGVLLGLESGGGQISYHGDSSPVKQAIDWNVGMFLRTQLMQYIAVTAAAGYTVYSPIATATPIAEPDFTGVYARLGLEHRVNQYVEYSLTGGRTINFGLYSGTFDMYTDGLQARWHLFQKLSIGTAFEYEHGAEILTGGETFDRFGPRLSLERPITAKLSGALRYQFYQRTANVPGGNYVINLLTLSLVYQL